MNDTPTLRPGLPELPARLRSRPLDARGYPVPWFVQWFLPDGTPAEDGEGVPDFRVVDARKKVQAHNHARCWVCGQRLGSYLAFVVGPMCAVNRTSGEPPAHRECAVFSAIACPFLTRPQASRRESKIPEGAAAHPGGLRRNPGVALVWITKSYRLILQGKHDYLVTMGDPLEILYFAEGRRARRSEVLESVESGLPLLMETAESESPAAVEALLRQVKQASALWSENAALWEPELVAAGEATA